MASTSSPQEREETAENVIWIVLEAKSFYDVIGVSPQASQQQIRANYIKRSRLIHPDKCNLPKSTEAFQRLGNAYQTIGNEDSRRRYDLTGQSESSSDPSILFAQIFEKVINEMKEGKFSSVIDLVNMANEADPSLNLNSEFFREGVQQMEASATALRPKFERLGEIDQRFRRVRFFHFLEILFLLFLFGETIVSMILVLDDHYLQGFQNIFYNGIRFLIRLFHGGLEWTASSIQETQKVVNRAKETVEKKVKKL